MGQLAARTFFSRRIVYKLLMTRKMPAHRSCACSHSPLTHPREAVATDPDAVLVGDMDLSHVEIEEWPISN